MSSRSKKIAVVVLAVAIAGGGAAYYAYGLDDRADDGTITLYGNIDIREADLAFNVAGRIERMVVEEGDRVERGTLLAILDDATYRAAVEIAKARVAAVRAALDRLLAGSRPEEIESARADIRAIDADLDDARANLRRTEKLALDRFAPLQKLDQDRARVKGLEARLKAAQQALSLAIQGPRKEDIAEARARLRADQAALGLELKRLEYTRLSATGRAVIKVRVAEPGAVVLAHSPVYTVALSDPVWARSYIAEPDLGRVRPGMKAGVVTDSAPDRVYDGWVGFISPVAEFTPKSVETPDLRTSLVYRIRVYVKNPDGGLRQGMPVTVRLQTAPPSEGAGPAVAR
jgi:membrane fusion protein YbhG